MIAALLLFFSFSLKAQGSADCNPSPQQTRQQVESCLGKPLKNKKIKDDRGLSFEVAWYPVKNKGDFKFYQVTYDPAKKGLVCDAGLVLKIIAPAKDNYVCYPGTGKNGEDLVP